MTFAVGARVWYVDAMGHRVDCTVTRDEGPNGRVYVKIDRVKGEAWFDAHELDRLTVSGISNETGEQK